MAALRFVRAILLPVLQLCAAASPDALHFSLSPPSTTRTLSLLRGVDRGPLCSSLNASIAGPLLSSGTSLIRTHDAGVLDWCVVFPNVTADPNDPSNYDWSGGDQYFDEIVSSGFTPYIRLGVSWSYPSKACLTPNVTTFTTVSVAMLRRYNGRCSGCLRFVEIWNEPDEIRFWNSSSADFYSLFEATARAVRAFNATLKIGGPGVAFPLSEDSNFSFGLLDFVAARNVPLDFFSWHTYGNISAAWGHNTSHLYFDTIVALREAFAARGLSRLAQHVTEWQPIILGDAVVTNSAEAAAFTASALSIMATAPDVEVSVFYPGCEGVGPNASWGLFLDFGNSTMAWRRESYAWLLVGTLLRDTPFEIVVTASPSLPTASVLAGSNADGTKVNAVVSARAMNASQIIVSVPFGGSSARVEILILDDDSPTAGRASNMTVPVENGLARVTVDVISWPAVISVNVSVL